jgi:hypothetical protein
MTSPYSTLVKYVPHTVNYSTKGQQSNVHSFEQSRKKSSPNKGKMMNSLLWSNRKISVIDGLVPKEAIFFEKLANLRTLWIN